MRKEYEKSGLPDYENPDMNAEKEKEKEFIKKIEKREKETGRKLDIGIRSPKNNRDKAVSRTINGIKNQRLESMPLRLAYQKDKIDMGKLPIWYLQAIGSMTIEEKRAFEEKNKKDLTINEIIAGQLLDDVLEKDEDATKLFWDLQKTMMSKKTVINEIHQTIKKPDSIMSDILAGIENEVMEAETRPPKAKITKKPQAVEGEVIEGGEE